MTPAELHAKAIRHWAQADRGLRGEELRAAADFIEAQAAKQDREARRASLWKSYDDAVRAGDSDAATVALRALLRMADEDEAQRKEQP